MTYFLVCVSVCLSVRLSVSVFLTVYSVTGMSRWGYAVPTLRASDVIASRLHPAVTSQLVVKTWRRREVVGLQRDPLAVSIPRIVVMQGGSKSKLLILSEYVDNTEKI